MMSPCPNQFQSRFASPYPQAPQFINSPPSSLLNDEIKTSVKKEIELYLGRIFDDLILREQKQTPTPTEKNVNVNRLLPPKPITAKKEAEPSGLTNF